MRIMIFLSAVVLPIGNWRLWPVALIAAGLDQLYCWARLEKQA
jgi:hypothetical protein